MENRAGILLPCAICEADAALGALHGWHIEFQNFKKKKHGSCRMPPGNLNEEGFFPGRRDSESDLVKHKFVRKITPACEDTEFFDKPSEIHGSGAYERYATPFSASIINKKLPGAA